eukprot:m.16518 g.16518  ORF g.16518 m.16518 type:complete len:298 (-) comp11078_c0_seq1:112-1005(-)
MKSANMLKCKVVVQLVAWILLNRISNADTACVLEPQPQVVVFTRVPKTASTEFMALAFQLAKKNGFKFTKINENEPNRSIFYQPDLFKNAVQRALDSGEKQFVQTHNHHPNIYDPRVAYINFIRAPYARCRSYYTFMRFDIRRSEAQRQISFERYGNKTFAACVEDPKCKLDCGHSMASHFCESDNCSLSEALFHLRQTAFIGDSNAMDLSLELIEQQIPSFFKGVVELASNKRKAGHHKLNQLSNSVQFADYSNIRGDLFKSALTRIPNLDLDVSFYGEAQAQFWRHRQKCLPTGH